jgi:1,4-alpha-glucan branching enzyme
MAPATIESQLNPPALGDELQRIVDARHHDPFSVLGRHRTDQGELVRAFIPHAREVRIEEGQRPMTRIDGTDIFEWRGPAGLLPDHYHLAWRDQYDAQQKRVDAYCFGPQVSDFDLYLFGEGRHWHVYRILGAHEVTVDGARGVLFATWAPSAERVSVVGDFNHWDGRAHPMRVRGGSGVWELFIPGLHAGAIYKFELRNREHGTIHVKSDPYGQRFELRPSTASIVAEDSTHAWRDSEWMSARTRWDWMHAPVSIYEVHLGSWQRDEHGFFLGYRELAHRLADYVVAMGYTHVELLPIAEHPLDASWGYQTLGNYAPTSRFGSPDDFRYFVDHMHARGLGVILDWVPAHFPKDEHGLARFDGSALYEHEDPRRGEHRDWGTLIYNYGRNEVKNYLISSSVYWLEEFHIDGLRVDAVASMLYLDYSRQPGDWVPNMYGGRENLEAITFLREMNEVTHGLFPGVLVCAEESTAWPQVTRPTYVGGLGFSLKWNMGWMHDTLVYASKEPVHRQYHHNELTFGMLYAFTENFILPFSHDEVVHGKASMFNKMPGDDWQKAANLRALYTYMYTYPGKKLLFMGNEFAHGREWDHSSALDWWILDFPHHKGVQSIVRDLNHLYRDMPALHRHEFDGQGFEWIDCHDSAQSVISYARKADGDLAVVIFNFTPVVRHGYRIGVPRPGYYRVMLNSDSEYYWGSNVDVGLVLATEPVAWMGHGQSLVLTLPPLAGVILRHE